MASQYFEWPTPANSGSFIPNANNTYDLGTSALEWRNLYLAGKILPGGAAGSANQIYGLNSGATANEYKTLSIGTSGSDFAISNAANSIVLNLPDAGTSARGAITTAAQTVAGVKTLQDGLKLGVSGTPTGYTPSTISGYEEGTFTANFNQSAGAGGSSTSKTITFRVVGKVVFLNLPNCSDMTAGATSSEFSTATSTIPTRLLPIQNSMWMGRCSVNGAVQAAPGLIIVQTDGAIVIRRIPDSSANFTSGNTNNGIQAIGLAYPIS